MSEIDQETRERLARALEDHDMHGVLHTDWVSTSRADALAPVVADLIEQAEHRGEARLREAFEALVGQWPTGDNRQEYRHGVNQAVNAIRAALTTDGTQ